MTQTPYLPSPRIFRKCGKNYRRWTAGHKRQIVEETFAPGSSVSIVARRHDVNANQVFKWRRLYQRGALGESVQAIDGFLPVGVIGHDGLLVTEQEKPDSVPAVPSAAVAAVPVQAARPVITVSLREGVLVRMEGDMGLSVLRCVLKTVLGEP